VTVLNQELRKRAEAHFELAMRSGEVRLVQRVVTERLMAGMWELPSVPPNGAEPLMKLRHSITTTDYAVFIYACSSATKRPGARWFSTAKLAGLPLTGLARKVLMRVGAFASNR
jgi:A/G-specific adenine glycosylase